VPNPSRQDRLDRKAGVLTGSAATSAALLNEALNGISTAKVHPWECGGQAGYWVDGVTDADGEQIIDRWVRSLK
jgi:hypothetical protein